MLLLILPLQLSPSSCTEQRSWKKLAITSQLRYIYTVYTHTQPGSQTHTHIGAGRGERQGEGGRDTPAVEKQAQSLSPHLFITFQQEETLPPAAATSPTLKNRTKKKNQNPTPPNKQTPAEGKILSLELPSLRLRFLQLLPLPLRPSGLQDSLLALARLVRSQSRRRGRGRAARRPRRCRCPRCWRRARGLDAAGRPAPPLAPGSQRPLPPATPASRPASPRHTEIVEAPWAPACRNPSQAASRQVLWAVLVMGGGKQHPSRKELWLQEPLMQMFSFGS